MENPFEELRLLLEQQNERLQKIEALLTPVDADPLKKVRIVDIAEKYQRDARSLGNKAKTLGIVVKGTGRALWIEQRNEQLLISKRRKAS